MPQCPLRREEIPGEAILPWGNSAPPLRINSAAAAHFLAEVDTALIERLETKDVHQAN